MDDEPNPLLTLIGRLRYRDIESDELCLTCDRAADEMEHLMDINIRMRAALGSIIIRCSEGDKKSDWLPVIESIARNAIDNRTPTNGSSQTQAKVGSVGRHRKFGQS